MNFVRDFRIHFAYSRNATLLSYSISGGSNYGGVAGISQSGSQLIMMIPGPINSGVNFQFPAVNMHVRAQRRGAVADPGPSRRVELQ